MDLGLCTYGYLILRDNILGFGLITVSVIAGCCIWLSGCYAGVIIIICYLCGFYVFHLMRKYVNELECLLTVGTRKYLDYAYQLESNQLIVRKEEVVPDGIESKSLYYPDLMVSLKVDTSVDRLLSRILDEYVASWYNSISSDCNFRYKISVGLRRAICVIVQRVLQIDVNTIVTKKFIPIYLKHLEDNRKLTRNNFQISSLHVAVLSRHSELLYLQNVSKCVLTDILPPCDRDCSLYALLSCEILSRWVLLPLSDAVCNPLILDSLLLQYLEGNISSDCGSSVTKHHDPHVELLRNFVDKFDSKTSHLHPAVHQILKDPYLLDAFMQFMKAKRQPHLLQFCMDIDKFNEVLLKPDLTTEEMDFLYKDAWDIYCIYFSPNSPNCIQFKNDLASTLRKVLSKDVTKLRTSTTLYEAYEHVYSLIEKRYCNEFYNSNEYFSWLYSYSESPANNKTDTNASSYGSSPVRSSFGKKTMQEISIKLNKIKDALKSNSVMEGEVFDTECKSADAYLDYFEVEDDSDDQEDGDGVSLSAGTQERNLNKWRVSIASMGSRSDPETNKLYTVFVIHVRNEEDNGDEWLVERRPTDFYSLDAKLIEFHGSFPDVQMPPKPRLFKEPLENMQFYENYLNKLLNNPVLKRSELLYSFLKSGEEFEEESSFGRLFRKSVVPNSLKRVKGQYLEPFIQAFVSANEKKSKASKHNSRDSMMTRESSLCLDTIFGNNFGVQHFDLSQITLTNKTHKNRLNCNNNITLSKQILYFGIKMYKIPRHIIRVLTTLHLFFGTIIDMVFDRIISKFLNNVITSDNVTNIVDIIYCSIFDNKSALHSEEINASLSQALSKTRGTFFHPVYVSLHKSFQNPIANKQLYYKLLDSLMEELFPELNFPSDS